MKKLGSKGFGVVEGLLIIVVLALIGAIGWYVITQNKTEEAETTQQTTTEKADEAEKSLPNVDEDSYSSVVTEEGVVYTHNTLGFSFTIPKTWIFQDNYLGDDTDKSLIALAEVTSPDYSELMGENGSVNTSSGAKIWLTVRDIASAQEKYVAPDKILKDSTGTGNNYAEIVAVDVTGSKGVEAVLSKQDSKSLITSFNSGPNNYVFSLDEDVVDETIFNSEIETYRNIVKSFTFGN